MQILNSERESFRVLRWNSAGGCVKNKTCKYESGFKLSRRLVACGKWEFHHAPCLRQLAEPPHPPAADVSSEMLISREPPCSPPHHIRLFGVRQFSGTSLTTFPRSSYPCRKKTEWACCEAGNTMSPSALRTAHCSSVLIENHMAS